MIQYSTLHKDRGTLAQYRNFSKLIPWCFEHGMEIAAELVVGTTPVITVEPSSGQASVHCLAITELQLPRTVRAHMSPLQLGPEFIRTYSRSQEWIKSSTPFWMGRHKSTLCTLHAVHTLGSVPLLVDGSSAGLSMIFCHFSSLLGLPLPANVIASCALNAAGIAPVLGLREKIRFISSHCPGIGKIMVHSSQLDEAHEVQMMGCRFIEPIAVSSIEQALDLLVLPDTNTSVLQSMLDAARGSNSERFHKVMFRSVVEGTHLVYGWRHVHKIAEGSEQPEMQFLSLISSRYAGLEAPSSDQIDAIIHWVKHSDLPDQLKYLSHLVQHISDQPQSLSNEQKNSIKTLYEAHVPASDCTFVPAPYLKLWGAIARLHYRKRAHLEAANITSPCK